MRNLRDLLKNSETRIEFVNLGFAGFEEGVGLHPSSLPLRLLFSYNSFKGGERIK
jgi:hypothetical protein